MLKPKSSNKFPILVWIIVVLMIISVLCWFGPRDAQIHIGSGDLRYRTWWVVTGYKRIKPPYQQWLKPILPADDRWISVEIFPHSGSNNHDTMCQHFYEKAAVWASVDQQIGKAVLDSTMKYILNIGAQSGLPSACRLNRFINHAKDGTLYIDPGWKNDELALRFLKTYGIEPPL